MPVYAALSVALRPLGLTYTRHYGALFITSPESVAEWSDPTGIETLCMHPKSLGWGIAGLSISARFGDARLQDVVGEIEKWLTSHYGREPRVSIQLAADRFSTEAINANRLDLDISDHRIGDVLGVTLYLAGASD